MPLLRDVSVIIPNRNNSELLRLCLDALLKNERIKEIIVVDDASTDDSLAQLRGYNLEIIENDKNYGPVRSRNIGAGKASGKYLLFLDSDMRLQPDYIATLAGFLEQHPKAAAASGKILSKTHERIWFNFGYPFSLRSSLGNTLFIRTFGRWHGTSLELFMRKISLPFTLNFAPEKIMKVGWVIESAFMTPREIFEELRGFDENFFMFHEGPDYSERARAKGKDTWYTPETSAFHMDGQSHSGSRRQELRRRSSRYWRQKHGLRIW